MLLLEHLEYTCVNRKSPGIICHNPVLKSEKEKKKMVLCALRSTSPIGSSIRLPLPGSLLPNIQAHNVSILLSTLKLFAESGCPKYFNGLG